MHKIDLQQNILTMQWSESNKIPPNLASATEALVLLHKINKDIHWLLKKVEEAALEYDDLTEKDLVEEMQANHMDNPLIVQLLTNYNLLP